MRNDEEVKRDVQALFNASVGLMIAARYGFPIDGIRSYLDEGQFAALFEPEPGPSM